jgi:hypothetical protein
MGIAEVLVVPLPLRASRSFSITTDQFESDPHHDMTVDV